MIKWQKYILPFKGNGGYRGWVYTHDSKSLATLFYMVKRPMQTIVINKLIFPNKTDRKCMSLFVGVPPKKLVSETEYTVSYVRYIIYSID